MNSNQLPAVLTDDVNSISMERALNQIKELLLGVDVDGGVEMVDSINASLDDVEIMLKAIVR